MKSICGADCSKCNMKEKCKGCEATNGHPFGGNCVLASSCNYKLDDKTSYLIEKCKAKLIEEFNSLEIKDMEKVTELYAINGSFINMEYKLPNGKNIKLLNDNDIYLGNQLHKKNSGLCYGLAADNNYLLVCEYGENGTNPQIVIYAKRNK